MTIKDIAAKCGVSVSTVSRVLNDHPYVKDDVRELVLKVIEEEHFVPNTGAIDLVRSQADSIGLVIRGMGNIFLNEMVSMFETTIKNIGYTFCLSQISADENELLAAATLAKTKNLKGIILLGGRYDYTPQEIAVLDVPFVCCTFTNSFGEISKENFSSVSINDRKEAKKAVDLLLEGGHRKIAILLPGAKDHSISELRYKGYVEALAGYGIEPENELVIETGDFTMEAAYEKLKTALHKGVEFTALFAISDSIAIAAMKALNEAGIRVPRDCSIIAIDGIGISEYMIPTLTTLVQPREQLAEQSVKVLQDIIEKHAGHRQVEMKTLLRAGGSFAEL